MKRSELDIYNRFGVISNIKEILTLADYLDSLEINYWLKELKDDWKVGKYRLKIEIPFPELLLKPKEFFTSFTYKINCIKENCLDSFEFYWISGLLNASVKKEEGNGDSNEEEIWRVDSVNVYGPFCFPEVLDISSMLFSQNPVMTNRLVFLADNGKVYVRSCRRIDQFNDCKIVINGTTFIPINELNPYPIIQSKLELNGITKYSITRRDFYCFSDGLFIENEEITKIVGPMLRNYLIDPSNSDDYLFNNQLI